jgi:hypothetical protein
MLLLSARDHRSDRLATPGDGEHVRWGLDVGAEAVRREFLSDGGNGERRICFATPDCDARESR